LQDVKMALTHRGNDAREFYKITLNGSKVLPRCELARSHPRCSLTQVYRQAPNGRGEGPVFRISARTHFAIWRLECWIGGEFLPQRREVWPHAAFRKPHSWLRSVRS